MIIINIILIIIIIFVIIFLYKNNNKNYKDSDNSEYTNFNYTVDYISNINSESNTSYDKYELPKIIYGYWDDPDNELINTTIAMWKRNAPFDWKIIFINKNNLKNYVSEKFIEKYKDLSSTRFSDFLRLELLKTTGGVWMDASTLIINSDFLNDYRDEMIRHKYDVLLYNLTDSNLKDTPYLENWFIMAPQNSFFIKDWYKEFDKAFEMDFINYKKTILVPSSVNLTKTIGDGDETYLMQHAIINYLFSQGKKYKITVRDSYNDMFKIHKKLSWENDKIIEYIINNNNWNDLNAVKLTGSQRQYINSNNYKQYIDKLNSL